MELETSPVRPPVRLVARVVKHYPQLAELASVHLPCDTVDPEVDDQAGTVSLSVARRDSLRSERPSEACHRLVGRDPAWPEAMSREEGRNLSV